MTAAYCSYCDAETEAGRGGVCARCGNRRANRSRGDRMIIDDPHSTMKSGEIGEMSQRVRDFLDSFPKSDVPPVIIMARLHQPESDK